MRVPKNIIKEAKYTSGGEFLYNNKLYVGYYIEINGQYYKGKKFENNNDLLIKINNKPNFNSNLLGQLINLSSNQIKSYIFKKTNQDINRGYSYRYFSKQNNINPISIKEIDEDSYKKLQNNYLYQVIKLKYNLVSGFDNKEVDEADLKMKGIKEFVQNINYTSDSEIDNYPLDKG